MLIYYLINSDDETCVLYFRSTFYRRNSKFNSFIYHRNIVKHVISSPTVRVHVDILTSMYKSFRSNLLEVVG